MLDFGSVYVGAERQLTFDLTAPGELPVHYQTELDGDVFGYLLGPAVGTVPASGGVEIIALFRPGAVGPANGRAVFASDASDGSTVVVELIGTGAPAPDCEDGNGCTTDTFDPSAGRCIHRAEPFSCQDFSACTSNDVCVEGECLGESVSCDDDDPCTDDFCDLRSGCVFQLVGRCDDANPCTADICTANEGCEHADLADGTPCDDFVPCTFGDICFAGSCIGVNVDDGTVCDDHDPCSKNDQCLSGVCRDPDYEPKAPGELKFSTRVGPLSFGAPTNPLVDRDGTTWMGTSLGFVGVDQCGDIVRTATIGTPTWGAAILFPGAVSVPVENRLLEVTLEDGIVQRDLELTVGFPPAPATATVSALVFDLAARSSGVILASIGRRVVSQSTRIEGAIMEVDSSGVVTRFIDLGPSVARRLLVDRDESIVALLSSSFDDRPERVARFGIDGVASSTWSTNEARGPTHLALDGQGRTLWSDGLVAIDRHGSIERWIARTVIVGGPVVGTRAAYLVDDSGRLSSTSSTGVSVWSLALPDGASGTPAIDAQENVFVVGRGALQGVAQSGDLVMRLPVPVIPADGERPAVTLTQNSIIVFAADAHVVGVQWSVGLSGSVWPRSRRDNLGTAHR